MSTLVVRNDQTWWDDDQAAVLQQSGIDADVTRPELASFLHLCQRTGLDPFARQIYLIGRWDSRKKRKVYTPQTGIDGYRVIAQRICAAAGQHLGYEDTQWCGADGAWTDAWLSADPPAAARVTVLRDGQRFPAVALWSEYRQTTKDGGPSGMWARMPAAQLAKCAESLALRKAFPNDLAGLYTAEEMQQAEHVTAPASVPTSVAALAPDPGPVEASADVPPSAAPGPGQTSIDDAEVVEP